MKKFKWNKDIKDEMINFFEDNSKKHGYSVKENSVEFAKLHPEMTESQVKTAYYRFYKEFDNMNKKNNAKTTSAKNIATKNVKSKKVENNKADTKKTGTWSENENKRLLQMMENRGTQSMQAVYEKFSQKTGRPIKNVAQHHYILTKNEKNNKIEIDISNKIKKLPDNVANSLIALINSLEVAHSVK